MLIFAITIQQRQVIPEYLDGSQIAVESKLCLNDSVRSRPTCYLPWKTCTDYPWHNTVKVRHNFTAITKNCSSLPATTRAMENLESSRRQMKTVIQAVDGFLFPRPRMNQLHISQQIDLTIYLSCKQAQVIIAIKYTDIFD